MSYFWIDLISIGLVAFTTILCYFRGFFSSLLSVLGFVGSFLIAYLFKEEVLGLFESLFGLKSWLNGFLSESIANVAGLAISVILTFLIIRVLVFILNHTIGKLFKGKVLGKTNAVLGSFLGVVQGVSYVLIIMVAWNMASLIPQVNNWTNETFSQTIFVGAIYDFVGDEMGQLFQNTPEEPEEEPEQPLSSEES